jgi:hypothetical protein
MMRIALVTAALAAGAALPAAAQTGPQPFCNERITVTPGSRPTQNGTGIQYFAFVAATQPGSVTYTLSFTPPPPAMGATPMPRQATQDRSFVIIGSEVRTAPLAPPSVLAADLIRYIGVTCS